MFKIKLTAKAKKELRAISKLYKYTIAEAIEEIKEDPFSGKPLTRELIRKFSYKIADFRIIYKINKRDKIVDILTAGHRSTIYG